MTDEEFAEDLITQYIEWGKGVKDYIGIGHSVRNEEYFTYNIPKIREILKENNLDLKLEQKKRFVIFYVQKHYNQK